MACINRLTIRGPRVAVDEFLVAMGLPYQVSMDFSSLFPAPESADDDWYRVNWGGRK